MGDFNVVFHLQDKARGRGVGNSNDASFISFFNFMGGINIRFISNKFTWDNGRKRRKNIHERLDRAICNDSWRQEFLKVAISHVVSNKSKFLALCLVPDHDRDFKLKPFHFLAIWLKKKYCKEVISKAWKTNISKVTFNT